MGGLVFLHSLRVAHTWSRSTSAEFLKRRQSMKTYAVRIVVITLALGGCLAPVTWAAEQDSNPSLAADLGLGLASFACSVPYGAVKVSTAILGGIMGSFTYVLSGFDKRAADSVWYTTIKGDYIVTPDHLRGNRGLHFTGVPPENAKYGS